MSCRPRLLSAVLTLAAVLAAREGRAQLCFDLGGSTKVGVDRNGGTLDPGDLLDWTIVVANAGSCPATNVPVLDTLEAKQDFVSADKGGAFDSGSRMVSWWPATTPELVAIAVGGSVTLTVTTRISLAAPPASPYRRVHFPGHS